MNRPPAVVSQVYRDHEGRELTGQDYGSGAASLTLPDLATTAQPIRIQAVWDVVEVSGDTGLCEGSGSSPTCIATYQCSNPPAVTGVSVKSSSGSYTTGFACTEKYGAYGVNLDIMKGRTAQAIDYWQRTIRVTPVINGITVDTGVAQAYHLPPVSSSDKSWIKGNQANVDLLLIMTARPSPNSPIAGYAQCIQADQFGRCTVGHFNWVPEVLNQEGWAKQLDLTKESELHTALHEIVHVLGGIGPGSTQASSNFITSTGARAATADVLINEPDDPAYRGASKPVTYIKSPKVLNLTRTYFNCPTALGFPLEDVPLGKGAHWEARVAGPELMSYGSNSGQVYVSDITLAYLEDTGHYLANYSMAGPIVAPLYDEAVSLGTTSSFVDTMGNTYVAPPPLPPGIPRWGYQGGCDFLGYNGHPRNTMKFPYTCTKNNEYMCTSDNRMSAVCVIQNTWNTLPQQNSFGRYVQNSGSGTEFGPQPMTTGTSAGSTNSLPTFFQWYSSDAAAAGASGVNTATATTTGGYNDAMDYIPVPVGYWNCMFPQQGSMSNVTGSGDSGFSLSSIAGSFGKASDMSKFGGQARCPTCRCMNSSLMEMSSGNLNPTFPRYGLCYRTNCARPDYLQVGLRRRDSSVSWYRCPPAGGQLFVPGFMGSLDCPKAKQFCLLENISAVLYPEQPGCSTQGAPCVNDPARVAISLRLSGLPASAFNTRTGALTAAAVSIITTGLAAGVAAACPACIVRVARIVDNEGSLLYTAARRLSSVGAATVSAFIDGNGADAPNALANFDQTAAGLQMSGLFGTSITTAIAVSSSGGGLSDGGIVGIAVAAVLLLVAAGAICYKQSRPSAQTAGLRLAQPSGIGVPTKLSPEGSAEKTIPTSLP